MDELPGLCAIPSGHSRQDADAPGAADDEIKVDVHDDPHEPALSGDLCGWRDVRAAGRLRLQEHFLDL
jgi:hypothetical protein